MCSFSMLPFDVKWVSALGLSLIAAFLLALATRKTDAWNQRLRLGLVAIGTLAMAATPLVLATYTAVDWTVNGDPCDQIGWSKQSPQTQQFVVLRLVLPVGIAMAVFIIVLLASLHKIQGDALRLRSPVGSVQLNQSIAGGTGSDELDRDGVKGERASTYFEDR